MKGRSVHSTVEREYGWRLCSGSDLDTLLLLCLLSHLRKIMYVLYVQISLLNIYKLAAGSVMLSCRLRFQHCAETVFSRQASFVMVSPEYKILAKTNLMTRCSKGPLLLAVFPSLRL